jgi:hypothetical protein
MGGCLLRILLLGSDNLAAPLRKLGQSVFVCAPDADADLPLEDPDPPWELLQRLGKAKGLTWDAIVVTDHLGGRRLPTGLAQAEAVTAFWGLDAPLNGFWQTDYARLFDLACLDQPDPTRELGRYHGAAHWLPVGVQASLYEGPIPQDQNPGLCFVGVVNDILRPKRSALLAKVAKITSVQVRGGRQGDWFSTAQAAQLYRSCQVVLNENLFPGLTTRPLEAMASGGCLLSEAAPGAMDAYFEEGVHLSYFDPANIEHKIELLLGDAKLRRRLAEAGREVVADGHTLEHRARRLIGLLEGMAAQPCSARPRAAGGEALLLEGQALFMAGLRWPQDGATRRLLRAAGRLQAAAADGAPRLPAYRAVGQAMAVLSRDDEAWGYLSQAEAQSGHPSDALALGLLAFAKGKPGPGRAALARAGLSGAQPGEARFHAEAAALLRGLGRDMEPGFDLRFCAVTLWTALEHLLESVRLDPGRAKAWEGLGDLLLARQAPNQAAACLARAESLGQGVGVTQKLEKAMTAGYMV